MTAGPWDLTEPQRRQFREAQAAAAERRAEAAQQATNAALQAAIDGDLTRISSSSVRVLLEAATPHLVAAERERCARLIEAEMNHPGAGGGLPGVNLTLQHVANLLREEYRP